MPRVFRKFLVFEDTKLMRGCKFRFPTSIRSQEFAHSTETLPTNLGSSGDMKKVMPKTLTSSLRLCVFLLPHPSPTNACSQIDRSSGRSTSAKDTKFTCDKLSF